MMTTFRFDDRNIHWHKLGDFEHFVYTILDIDQDNSIADVIFKFEPHNPIVLHRHKVLNKTWVIQGEHRIYEPNGDLKEIRQVGSYTSSPANPDPHRECGGDDCRCKWLHALHILGSFCRSRRCLASSDGLRKCSDG